VNDEALQQLDLLVVLVRAQDEPERRVLVGLPLVLVQPAQVQLHLPLVARIEAAELQLHGDERAQPAVEEEQVEVVVVRADRHALLPRDEAEALPQLQQEALQLPQDGRLQLALAVVGRQAEEVEDVRISEDEVRGRAAGFAERREGLLDDRLGPPGDGRALVEHARDLLLEGPGAPGFEAAQLDVEAAPERVVQGDQLPQMGPAQL
jgi:hypothetical protein